MFVYPTSTQLKSVAITWSHDMENVTLSDGSLTTNFNESLAELDSVFFA